MRRFATMLAAFALGLVHAAGFAPATHWLLALGALAGLFALDRAAGAQGASARARAGLAWVFGLGWFGAGLSWLYVSMHVYGGMPAPMAAAAVVLFAGYLSLYPAAAAWVAARMFAGRGPLVAVPGLAAAWTLAELARGWVLTGFPWLAVGYAQLDGPLDRLAPLTGVFGIGGVAVAVAALLARAIRAVDTPAGATLSAGGARASCALVALVLIAAPLAVPRDGWTSPAGEPLRIRLVQGNVPQDMKFRPERVVAAMQDYASRFEAGDATLTILPETAWTVPWDRTPEPVARRILDHVAAGHALAVGLPAIVRAADGETFQLANSVMLLSPGRNSDPHEPTQRYDKRHLVPFGEFVPWGFRWFVDMMAIPLGDFARGAPSQPPFAVGDQRVAFNICYEDLFGDEIREALPGERGATVLANVSNIAWFGNSHALPQHLAIARMRSLETGRPMVRATNTGTTAAIDAQGRVIARLEPHVAGVLDVVVQGTRGLTPFARMGNAAALVAALALLGASALAARTGGRAQSR